MRENVPPFILNYGALWVIAKMGVDTQQKSRQTDIQGIISVLLFQTNPLLARWPQVSHSFL